MKFVRITLAVLTLLSGAALFAQRAIRAEVPFDFFVGESKLLPAGTYRVFPCSPSVVKVENCQSGLAVLHLSNRSGESSTDAKLIFHKYGDKYFLRATKGPGTFMGLSLPQGQHEKKVMDELASVTTYETIEIPQPEESKPPQK